MKKLVLFSVLFGVTSVGVKAQDDMYFVPKKAKAVTMPVEERMPVVYSSGQLRDVDEYNRRGEFRSDYQVLGVDSLPIDTFEFEPGGYADTLFVDGGGGYGYEDDYAYSRRMSRFDDFYGYVPGYYGWYGPYWYGRPYWHSYYGWYDPWYDPWYYGWYGAWGYGWHYPVYWHTSYYRPYRGLTGTTNHGRPTRGANAGAGRDFTGYRGTNNRANTTNRRDVTRENNYNNNNNFRGNRDVNYGNMNTPSQPSYNNGGSFGGNRGGGFSGGGSFGGSRGGGGGSFGGRR